MDRLSSYVVQFCIEVVKICFKSNYTILAIVQSSYVS